MLMHLDRRTFATEVRRIALHGHQQEALQRQQKGVGGRVARPIQQGLCVDTPPSQTISDCTEGSVNGTERGDWPWALRKSSQPSRKAGSDMGAGGDAGPKTITYAWV
jgi:hypothetical protein